MKTFVKAGNSNEEERPHAHRHAAPPLRDRRRIFFTHADSETRHAVITQNNVELYDIPLTGHTGTEEIRISDEDGENIIRIEGETIAVIDADCPDLVCVHTGAASQKGDVIACLPHKLLIEVK